MHYFPCGNERVSLPRLNERAGLESVAFLHMGYRGLVELRGREESPLMEPFLRLDGQEVRLTDFQWVRREHWIPEFTCAAGSATLHGTVLCPLGERGFAIRLRLDGAAGGAQIGLRGCWSSAWHCVNEDKPLEGTMHVYDSAWSGAFVLDMRCGAPMFALAPMSAPACQYHYAQTERGIEYSLFCEGEDAVFYWGLGFEEVAAVTSAKEMLRRGWAWELARSEAWLRARQARLCDERLAEMYDLNLFFCIFFSTGVTLDTEEFVLVTSRSPRYYVSAAYWDRDSLLWAFPAVLDADAALARDMLIYAFTRQARNFGVHSRYIDGTVLEPGFELDELAAPILALERYIEATDDRGLLDEPAIRAGAERVLSGLRAAYDPALGLYETFLQPTDDERVHPYLTYDNALVWRALRALSRLWPRRYEALGAEAEALRTAIYAKCLRRDAEGRPFFAWSVDTDGSYDVYDEPPGSLQLLPYYGFCAADDEAYQNTVRLIRSPDYRYSFAGHAIAEIGCPHAPHPWVLSIANSLLCGRKEACAAMLRRMPMDNGIACESVHEDTGACTTGEAFATCAGFLAHAMRAAFATEGA